MKIVYNGDYPGLDLWRSRFYGWLRQGSALKLVFVFWLLGGNPALAFTRVDYEAKAGFSPVFRVIPVSDPADEMESRPGVLQSPTWNVGTDFESEFLARQHCLKGLNQWALDVDRGRDRSQYLAARLNFPRWRVANIEAQDRGPNVVAPVVRFDELNRVDANFWAVSGMKFIAGKFEGPSSGPPKRGSKSRNDQTCNRCDSDPVRISEAPSTPNISRDDGRETAVASLATLFAFIAAFLTYASLEKRR